MLIIKYSVQIQQKSTEQDLFFEDHDAVVISDNSYSRIMYRENEGIDVVLDISRDQLSLKRHDEWITHGFFAKDEESYILINNELGILKFEVEVIEYLKTSDSVYLQYELKDEKGLISKHEYICRWNRRDE